MIFSSGTGLVYDGEHIQRGARGARTIKTYVLAVGQDDLVVCASDDLPKPGLHGVRDDEVVGNVRLEFALLAVRLRDGPIGGRLARKQVSLLGMVRYHQTTYAYDGLEETFRHRLERHPEPWRRAPVRPVHAGVR